MKKTIIFITLALLTSIWQSAGFAQALYNGTFKGPSALTDGTVTLSLQYNNQAVSGQYSESDNPDALYKITGTVTDGILHGRMVCIPTPILSFRFTCKQSGNLVHFSLDSKFWASIIPALDLVKESPDGLSGSSGLGNASFDSRLVGKWTCSKTYGSGSFSTITTQIMIIRPDATMQLSEPSISASTADSYINSPSQASMVSGKISIQGNKIYSVAANGSIKGLIASYTVSGDRLRTISASGEKQFWTK